MRVVRAAPDASPQEIELLASVGSSASRWAIVAILIDRFLWSLTRCHTSIFMAISFAHRILSAFWIADQARIAETCPRQTPPIWSVAVGLVAAELTSFVLPKRAK